MKTTAKAAPARKDEVVFADREHQYVYAVAMKYLSSDLAAMLLVDREARSNIRSLVKYLLFLAGLVTVYAVLFHLIKVYVEGEQHSWITGVYWTLVVTGYPAPLGKRPPAAILKAVADHLSRAGRAPERKQLLYDLLSLMACHGAVRAGDRLTAEEISALVAQRHLARDGHHCPHGRPTTVVFSRRELERLFKRV